MRNRPCLKVGQGRKDGSLGTWDAGTRDMGCRDMNKNKFEKKKFSIHCFCMGILFNLTASEIH